MTIPQPRRRSGSVLLAALADVMFVLLFFFMLTAASVDRRGLALTTSTRQDTGSSKMEEIPLRLLGPDRWRLGTQELAPTALADALRASGAGRVRIIATPGLPLQSMIDAISVVRAAGIPLQLARAT